jgi:hypothetical protein
MTQNYWDRNGTHWVCDAPLLLKRPFPVLQPHRCFGKETTMDNTIGNHPTFVSKVSKQFIFKHKNRKDIIDC